MKVIEENLLNYGGIGVLALILLVLLLRMQKKFDKQDETMIKVVENNTVALTKVYEMMRWVYNGRRPSG